MTEFGIIATKGVQNVDRLEEHRNRCSASTLLGLPGFVIDFSMDERREFLHGEYAGDSHDREDRA